MDYFLVVSRPPNSGTPQLMSNPDTFVEPRKRYSVEGRMFSIHFVADDDNRVYSCVTDKEYPARIAFALLEEMQTKFLTKVLVMCTHDRFLPILTKRWGW